MLQKIFYICLIILSMTSMGYSERVILEGGQTLEGKIVEEQTREGTQKSTGQIYRIRRKNQRT